MRANTDQKIFIYVRDTGKGMNNQVKRMIFVPGYTTKKRGWGLGLSLVKRIVEDYHKGKIYIKESHPGKGTTFAIEIPMNKYINSRIRRSTL
jgi:signal transduction histidine kinase